MADALHTSGDGETARILGRLEANVGAIEDRIARWEISSAARMSAIEHKLDRVVHTLAQSMGAMKLLHWFGGAVVAGLGFLASTLLRGR